MRVFVTGATGWIGSAVVPELLDAGHTVVGLARTETGAAALTAAGATPLHGSLDDLDTLRAGAAASDGVIHLAFIHDFLNFADSARVDLRAIETIGAALAGSGRQFVIPSGVLGLSRDGQPATEDSEPQTVAAVSPRQASIQAAHAFASQGVRISEIRLAPTVHGAGDHGFMAALVRIAREKGVSGYIDDGQNRWPAVHRLDAAHLFHLALESAPADAVFHGVTEEGIPIHDIAAVIGRHLDLPVVSVPREEANAHFGWLGALLGVDCPASSALTRERMAWQPTHTGLLADLDEGHYFSHA